MTRTQRIILVSAIGLTFAGLAISFVIGPLLAVVTFPTPDKMAANLGDGMGSLFGAFELISWVVSLGLSMAGLGVIAALVVVAAWFIGPAEHQDDDQLTIAN